MRTKTVIAAAALLAAGALCSMAQSNVYSVNVVGYVNVPINNGFTIIANQLDLDGTGANNSVNTVFSNRLDGVTVYSYNGGGYDIASFSTKGGGWSGNTTAVNTALNNGNTYGNGLFVKYTAATNLTLVGNVMQGTLSRTYPNGFSILGSRVPQGGLLQTDLGYTPNDSDTVYQFKANQTGYNISTYSTKGGGWSPQPTIAVGEGFWLKNATGGGTWTRNFTVAP